MLTGLRVGPPVGPRVGAPETGELDGDALGADEGAVLGNVEGKTVGRGEGETVGTDVVGAAVVGARLGLAVGRRTILTVKAPWSWARRCGCPTTTVA